MERTSVLSRSMIFLSPREIPGTGSIAQSAEQIVPARFRERVHDVLSPLIYQQPVDTKRTLDRQLCLISRINFAARESVAVLLAGTGELGLLLLETAGRDTHYPRLGQKCNLSPSTVMQMILGHRGALSGTSRRVLDTPAKIRQTPTRSLDYDSVGPRPVPFVSPGPLNNRLKS